MKVKGATIFLHFPHETARRILHPSMVAAASQADTLTIVPENPELGLEAGLELLI